jgi:hypothetical protein
MAGISVPGVNIERTGKFAFLPQGTLGTQLSQCEKHKSHGKIVYQPASLPGEGRNHWNSPAQWEGQMNIAAIHIAWSLKLAHLSPTNPQSH